MSLYPYNNGNPYNPYAPPDPAPPSDPIDPGMSTSKHDPSCESGYDYAGEYGLAYGQNPRKSESAPETEEERKKRLDKLLEEIYDLSRKLNKTPEEDDRLKKLCKEYEQMTGSSQPGFM
jgi:hypothetical protein